MSEAERRPAPFYGRRHGRKLNQGRRTLLEDLLPAFRLALSPDETFNPAAAFAGPVQDVWLEIGFGNGEHLAAQAARHPSVGFIGCEPFLNGVSAFLGLVDRYSLTNVRVFSDDARLLLDRMPDDFIGRCFLLFSDPWPKKRHHRRRFIGPENLDRLARVLRPGAELRLATDHPDLCDWIMEQLAQRPDFTVPDGCIRNTRPADWPETRYEQKAIAAGREPVYISAFAC